MQRWRLRAIEAAEREKNITHEFLYTANLRAKEAERACVAAEQAEHRALTERDAAIRERDEAREKVIPTYMGLIKQIDDQIGVLMRFLEARGLLDTTKGWTLSIPAPADGGSSAAKLIASVPDIYGLRLDDVADLERMGPKSARNLLDRIEASKGSDPARLIFNARPGRAIHRRRGRGRRDRAHPWPRTISRAAA